jgi:hypothetical protein
VARWRAAVFAAVLAAAATSPAAARAAAGAGGWRVVARGNVAGPFWAAESPDGLVTLGHTAVPAWELGYTGGGTVQVPTSVELVATGGVLFRVPPGWAILNVAASTDGVVLTEGPVSEVGESVLVAAVWHLVAIPWFGRARVAVSSAGHGAKSGVTDLAAAGEYFGATILYTPPGGRTPTATFLAEGRFDRPGAVSMHYTAGGYLPTTLALDVQGRAVVGSLAYFGTGGGDVPFPAGARVLAVWLHGGVLLPGPGGVYAVDAHAVERVEAHGRSATVRRFPAGETVAWAAGSESGLVVALTGQGGRIATWTLGGVPRGFGLAGAQGLEQITLTGNGAAAVALAFTRSGLELRVRGWPMGGA